MHRIGILSAGIALAVTFAVLSAICAVATALWPDATIDFFGAFMHAVDLKAVKSAEPVSFGRTLYGVIGLGVVGFVAGIVFATVYNSVRGEG
jgi:hypothetical protein